MHMCMSLICLAFFLVDKSGMGRKKKQSCCELIINRAILFDIFRKPVAVCLWRAALFKESASSSLHALAKGTRERCDLAERAAQGRLTSEDNPQNPTSLCALHFENATFALRF